MYFMKTDAQFCIMTYQYHEVEKKEVVIKSTGTQIIEKNIDCERGKGREIKTENMARET